MALPIPTHVRRKADKVRIAGWINVPVSGVLAYFSPHTIPAIIGACFWILLFFGITQTIAWRLDKEANRLRGR